MIPRLYPTPAFIAAVNCSGFRLVDLAARLGVADASIRRVISGKWISHNGQGVNSIVSGLCEILGFAVAEALSPDPPEIAPRVRPRRPGRTAQRRFRKDGTECLPPERRGVPIDRDDYKHRDLSPSEIEARYQAAVAGIRAKRNV